MESETRHDTLLKRDRSFKTVTERFAEESKYSNQKKLSTTSTPIASSNNSKKSVKQPNWLLKLEQLKLKSLDEMAKNG